jgi:hypothetical protein
MSDNETKAIILDNAEITQEGLEEAKKSGKKVTKLKEDQNAVYFQSSQRLRG